MIRQVTAAVAVAAGLGLAVTAGFGLAGDRPAPHAFAVAPALAASALAPAGTDPATAAAALPGPAAGPAPPAHLWLPRLGVDAPVLPEPDVDGTLRLPDDPGRVGWWTGSRPAGAATGSTVLAGHVDTLRAGRGALFDVQRLRAGDEVLLTDATGRRHAYAVYQLEVVPKTAPLPADLSATDGPAHLVLVTCGGAYDRATHRYSADVVVRAAPVS